MLIPAALSDFPGLYDLIKASFPPDEYRTYENHLAILDHPRYTLLTNGDRTALISLWRFEDFTFVEHFAVSPQCRNRGLGTQILQEILSSLSCPVCLEAELPETDLARRRLDFYRRNGFTVNPFPYFQPAYTPDHKAVPMQILSTVPLTREQFEHIRDVLYHQVYRA